MLYIQRSKDTKVEIDKTLPDSRCDISGKKFNVCVIENDQGIIVDVYDPNGELITTDTYWDDDYD